ncbi:hypothetical protein DRJ00_07095 [Candidatus Aerophobetes bacterium]|uniref:Uncharacterized protein n=1 Tax=Aerophobetes bacterium TaxID=2030807 RepID=A0A497E560_UNCAE|nr:MAG: hypothetical protein DRJ00_07095 [Candidatus Aerophobetes bacterium]
MLIIIYLVLYKKGLYLKLTSSSISKIDLIRDELLIYVKSVPAYLLTLKQKLATEDQILIPIIKRLKSLVIRQ